MSHLHRRRGVGVGRSGAGMKQATQKKADELKAVSFQSAMDTLEKLEVKLTEFAKEHRTEIQKDPIFRTAFLKMCAPLGIDPLLSKKTILGNILGIGDYYYELGVQIIEVCVANRTKNGGLMSIKEIQTLLSQRKTRLGMTTSNAVSTNVSIADIQLAIQKLHYLGGGFRTVTIGNRTMVISVPTELENDPMTVLTIASAEQQLTCGITVDQIRSHTGWTKERIERAMESLLQQGMVWLDTYKNVDYYWCTSIWQDQQQQQIQQDETTTAT